MAHHYAVTAPDPAALRGRVEELIGIVRWQSGNAPASEVALSIDMPCGEHYEYPTVEDIPAESVECRCGSPEHHVIFYGAE